MQTIWYIHGAGASNYSFSFLQQRLRPHHAQFLSYEVTETTQSCIHRLCDSIARQAEPVVLIGHSLGGLIGRVCAQRVKVSHLVTLCAPFGGVKGMSLLKLFNSTPVFQDLNTYSPLLEGIRTTRIAAPHLAIVGSHGLPITSEVNDGVVSLASQTALDYPHYINFNLNHFEVLLSAEVAEVIDDFLGQ